MVPSAYIQNVHRIHYACSRRSLLAVVELPRCWAVWPLCCVETRVWRWRGHTCAATWGVHGAEAVWRQYCVLYCVLCTVYSTVLRAGWRHGIATDCQAVPHCHTKVTALLPAAVASPVLTPCPPGLCAGTVPLFEPKGIRCGLTC